MLPIIYIYLGIKTKFKLKTYIPANIKKGGKQRNIEMTRNQQYHNSRDIKRSSLCVFFFPLLLGISVCQLNEASLGIP